MTGYRFLSGVLLGLSLCFGLSRPVTALLSESDITLYRQIFTEQRQGHFAQADRLSDKIGNKALMGYVLYHRYFSPAYRTKKQEISLWLARYADLAVAADMYALGVQKKAPLPDKKPQGLFGGKAGTCSAVFRPEPIDLIRNRPFTYLSVDRQKKARKLMTRIYNALNRGKTLKARELVESPDAQNLFSQTDHDSARVALAFSYLMDGETERALPFIRRAIQKSGDQIPQSYWVAGLISWQRADYSAAADFFNQAAHHPKIYPFLESAAAVWAARAYLRTGQFEQVRPLLEKASKYQRLFYGILAMRLLAQDLGHVWDKPALPTDDLSADFSHPALERFYALSEIGEKEWAGKELSKLYLEADEESKGILFLISDRNGFSSDLLAISGTLGDGSTRYPTPNWTPRDGWKIDKALVYAFVRQESCFNERAESGAGALGLMQIMPDTGRELARVLQYPFRRQLLKEPEYNLALGQNYLLKLINMPAVGENLMYLATAYNAGPGNLIKWKKQVQTDDPLLFLEIIPSRETRSFVERIIVNYWIYRTLMNQPLHSLDAVVTGTWPFYKNQD